MESSDNANLLLNFLPRINHDNEQLKEFLIPFNNYYLFLKEHVHDLQYLLQIDRCPEKLLDHIASIFGFELIDRKYASDRERRQILLWVIWIYQRKGTIAAIEKIIELLGYSHNITEITVDKYPAILNHHRTYHPLFAIESEFKDDFTGNLSSWNSPINKNVWWRIDDGSLIGSGSGSNDYNNVILFDDDSDKCYLETNYEITDTGASTTYEFGLVLKYNDINNWLRLDVRRVVTNYVVGLVSDIDGVIDGEAILTTDIVDVTSGSHKLWIHSDSENDLYTFGIDDITLAYKAALSTVGLSSTKKGLIINRDITVKYDSLTKQVIEPSNNARLLGSDFTNRKLQIELFGNPENDSERKEYLKRVIPGYVPIGIEIEWI